MAPTMSDPGTFSSSQLDTAYIRPNMILGGVRKQRPFQTPDDSVLPPQLFSAYGISNKAQEGYIRTVGNATVGV